MSQLSIVLNVQLRTVNKGQSSGLGVGWRANNSAFYVGL